MNKIIKNFLNNLDVILFLIFVTAKIMIFGRQIQQDYFSYKALFPSVIASVLIIVSISILFNKNIRKRFLFVFNILISTFILADLCYFRYFKDVISIPVLLNGFLLGDVKSSITTLLSITDLLYFIDIIIIIPITNRLIKNSNINYSNYSVKFKLSAFLILFIISIAIDGQCIYKLSKEQPRLISTMYNRIYVAKQIGNLNYHYLDIYNSTASALGKKVPISNSDKEAIKEFLSANSKSISDNLKGVAKDKNLIIIQVEALQEFAINAKINGNEITPNLNKWIKKSSYFNNYFYQVAAGGTSDAEFMCNNSLYPAASGAASYLYSGNEFNSLPKILADKGYDTAAFHGFRESFWNRNVMYQKYGFKNFYGEKSYTVNEKIGLGLSDKSFFNQSISKIKNLKQPFYSLFVTLTSHFPFDAVDKYGSFNVGEFEGTFLGNYLKSIHYADEQIGMFLNELEKEGLVDNSLIVLYGDHYAIPRDNEKELAKFMNVNSFNDLQWMELQKVPLMIHFPEDKYSGVNSIYGGEMDLLPTVANLFDFPKENMMGKDLFNSNTGTVIFRNGSITDGKVFYLSQTNTFYDIEHNKVLTSNETLKKLKESAINQLQYSDIILKHNLIKKFNSEK